ncbi:MAG: hypothetical protein LUH18_02050 [Oscillospiraceae bacterium]|nr:hypothetical protein [Oscillospiraceae bacterium]
MLKKVASVLFALVLCLIIAIGVYAGGEVAKVVESYNPLRSTDYTYGSYSLESGYTWILGSNTSTSGYYHINSGNAIVLKTKLSSNENNIEMGYYCNGVYTVCNWSSSGSIFGKYTYTCTMNIAEEGDYKFFISNKTAKTLTFTSTTISY